MDFNTRMITFLIIYFYLLPFGWALSPLEGIDLAISRIFSLGIIMFFVLSGLKHRRLPFPTPWILFFFSSFLVIITLSYVWAENKDFSIRKIIFLWNFLPLFIVFQAVTRDPSHRKNILTAFVGSATLTSLVGISQFFLQFVIGIEPAFALWTKHILPFFLGSSFGAVVADYPSLLVNISGATIMRASAFFPDPHMLSLYLGLSLPLAGALALQKNQDSRTFAYIAFVIILLADLLTFSRGGYLGLGAGLLSALIFSFDWSSLQKNIQSFITKRSERNKDLLSFPNPVQAKSRLIRIILGGVLVTLVCTALLFSPFGKRLLSSFSHEDGSNIERLRLWQETAGYIVDRPLLGVGIGNYSLLAKPSAMYREPIYAHNLFLDLASEIGLLGAFFFIGLLFLCFSKAWSAWRKNQTLFSLAIMLSLIIFSTHSLFELPLFSVQVLPAFLLILATASVL